MGKHIHNVISLNILLIIYPISKFIDINKILTLSINEITVMKIKESKIITANLFNYLQPITIINRTLINKHYYFSMAKAVKQISYIDVYIYRYYNKYLIEHIKNLT